MRSALAAAVSRRNSPKWCSPRLAGFGQGLEEVLAVNVVQEDVLTAVAAAHDLVHGARILNARLTRHGATVSKSGRGVKKDAH
jgi:hypothetical protein